MRQTTDGPPTNSSNVAQTPLGQSVKKKKLSLLSFAGKPDGIEGALRDYLDKLQSSYDSDSLPALFRQTEENQDQVHVPEKLRKYKKYWDHLPTRQFDSAGIKLCSVPCFIRPLDLADFASELINTGGRSPILYMASPTHTGKTASVLPGFLSQCMLHGEEQSRLTHYVYLAFHNNLGKHYKVNTDWFAKGAAECEPENMETLGMIFMKSCLEKQLKGEGDFSAFNPEKVVREVKEGNAWTMLQQHLQIMP